MIPLGSAIRVNPYLVELHLSNNFLGESGNIELARSVAVAGNVRKVNAAQTFAGINGGLEWAETLRKCTILQHLNLRSNMIGDSVCAQALPPICDPHSESKRKVMSDPERTELARSKLPSSKPARLVEVQRRMTRAKEASEAARVSFDLSEVGARFPGEVQRVVSQTDTLASQGTQDQARQVMNRHGQGRARTPSYSLRMEHGGEAMIPSTAAPPAPLPQMLAALTDNPSLTHLDLADNRLAYRAARALGQALAANTALTYLDVSWNHLRPIDFRQPPRPPRQHSARAPSSHLEHSCAPSRFSGQWRIAVASLPTHPLVRAKPRRR